MLPFTPTTSLFHAEWPVMAGIVNIASTLNACVDAFTFFTAAFQADMDIKKLLLRLDIEKTRLLIWGIESGLFSEDQQQASLRQESSVALLDGTLVEIEELLTDTEKLHLYGLRAPGPVIGENVNYVSLNSLVIFRALTSRFWTRNASKLGKSSQSRVVTRSRWAIYDKEKVQNLVSDLKALVDRVYELVPVDPQTLNSTIIADIKTITNISRLKIVEAATDESYRAYSEATTSVIASTEARTDDRRILEELLSNTMRAWPGPPPPLPPSPLSAPILRELESCTKYVVLTSKCRRSRSPVLCDLERLGSQAASYAESTWDVSSINEKGGNTLWQLINRLIGISSTIEILEEDDTLTCALLKQDGLTMTATQRGVLNASLPLETVHIYCSPCVCLIHTAFTICSKLSSPLVSLSIRPDDRLVSSCCVNLDRVVGLRKMLDWVPEWEATARSWDSTVMASYLDRVWIEQRLEHFDNDEPYTFVERRKSQVIILGEADYLTPILRIAPGRTPQAMDIWSLEKEGQAYTREFEFRFIESRYGVAK